MTKKERNDEPLASQIHISRDILPSLVQGRFGFREGKAMPKTKQCIDILPRGYPPVANNSLGTAFIINKDGEPDTRLRRDEDATGERPFGADQKAAWQQRDSFARNLRLFWHA
jgi:hypothetical protein